MCRNYTGQQRAMRSGLIDMILAIFGITAAVADVTELNKIDATATADEKSASASTLILLYVVIGISVLRFVMGFVLRKGASERNYKMVTAWLCSSIFLWLFQILQFIIKLAIGTFVLWSTITNSLAVLIRVVVMYVVYKFIQEIREESRPLVVDHLQDYT